MLRLKQLSVKLSSMRNIHGSGRIGNRDVVGHGCNGMHVYKDDAHFPFPAIRFKENNSVLQALREKEKGDWHYLAMEEKKQLYRASFCQTFAEFQHPTGTWKFILGWGLFFLSFAFWTTMFYHRYVNDPLPTSLSEISQTAQVERMISAYVNPIDGLSSKWDYLNSKWK